MIHKTFFKYFGSKLYILLSIFWTSQYAFATVPPSNLPDLSDLMSIQTAMWVHEKLANSSAVDAEWNPTYKFSREPADQADIIGEWFHAMISVRGSYDGFKD